MYHLNKSYIPIAYCDTLHASAPAGEPHTHISFIIYSESV